jgi:CHAD domain-containing protein
MRATAEHARKLDAPVGFQLPPLGGRTLEPRSFTTVYYDVPGRSLAASGITLRRRIENRQSVWQLTLPSHDFPLELEQPGGALRVPERLAKLLYAHLRHGPVEKVAELRTQRGRERVIRDGAWVEVTLDRVSIVEARRVRDRFVEIGLALRRGDPRRVERLARALYKAGAQRSAEIPQLVRAVGRGEQPAREGTAVIEALRAGLLGQLREIEAHDPGTRLGRDPESLHAMRVAVRRARAILRTARPVVTNDLSGLELRLQELGLVLGDVRDLDVLIERFRLAASELDEADRDGFRAGIDSFVYERSLARRRLLRMLASDSYLQLLDELDRTARELAPSRAATLSGLLDRQVGKLRKAAKALPKNPSDQELHAFRKQGKRTRYVAELVGNAKLVRRAKGLQDALGEHQDAVLARERLRELARAGDASLAFSAGRLAEREKARRIAARAQWPVAWRRLREAL